MTLRQVVSQLRKQGYNIRSNHDSERLRKKEEYGYQMVSDDYTNRWPCMIPKLAWPVCYGHGCRHRDKCEAVLRPKVAE